MPILVIHLSKSVNGRFTVNEAKDLHTIISIINSHPHFNVKFFAADGEQGLNAFHEEVINGELEIPEFTSKVIEKIRIMPILDPLHGSKNGRSKILKNTIKLSEKSQIINSEVLADHLDIQNFILNDKTSIGKMKDVYVLHLFKIPNAYKEFQNKNYSAGYYLLIYSMFLDIFRNPF